jgi:putative component of membrane protein insertase Oxa1/YidC/SpoIIIJ protein YidD
MILGEPMSILRRIGILPAFTLVLFSCAHTADTTEGNRPSYNPGYAIVHFYQHQLDSLSAVRATGCPMHPSCSEYTKEAMEKHGFLVGWMMGVDRLYRCGRDEKKLSPLVFVDGEWKYYDPVKRNDFWWHSSASASPQPRGE